MEFDYFSIFLLLAGLGLTLFGLFRKDGKGSGRKGGSIEKERSSWHNGDLGDDG